MCNFEKDTCRIFCLIDFFLYKLSLNLLAYIDYHRKEQHTSAVHLTINATESGISQKCKITNDTSVGYRYLLCINLKLNRFVINNNV